MSNMRHIILAVPGARYASGKGGIVRQMQYLAEESERHEDDVRFHWLTTHSNNRFWPLRFGLSLLRLIWLALCYRPAAIILNLASKGSFLRKSTLAKLARIFGLPYHIYLHGGGFSEFHAAASPALKAKIAALFQGAERIMVLGEGWRPFVQSLGCDAQRIEVIFNAVPDINTRSHDEMEEPHIIFAGHIIARKGLDELLHALVASAQHSWRATIAGSGEVAHYQALAESLGIEKRIHWPGWLDDAAMQALYVEADIFILPSHIENQPLCLLEAMAHSLAIITTRVGTIGELFEDGVDALVVPPHEPDILAEALAQMLASPQLQERLGIAARRRYEANHQLAGYYQKLTHI